MGGTLKPEFDANYPTKGCFLRYFEEQPPETKGPYDSRGCALDVQLTILSWCEAPEFKARPYCRRSSAKKEPLKSFASRVDIPCWCVQSKQSTAGAAGHVF